MANVKRRFSSFYFYNLFSKIALLSIILVILFTISLYFNFKNYSLDIINKSNEKILVQLSSNLNQINEYAVSFAATLSTNANCANLMYPETPDIYDTMRAITEIDLMIRGIPFLDSAYVYNGKIGMIYSMGPHRTMRTKENFYDKEIIYLLDKLDNQNKIHPIARRIINSDPSSYTRSDVYTYIIPQLFSGTNKVKNAVILNVKLDWIYNSLSSINDKQSNNFANNFIIIDKSGLVLGHSLKDLYLKNISDREYVKNILSSSAKSGFFESRDEGVRNVVTYVYIQDLECYMLSITPYDYIAASVNKVKNITLTIFLLLTLLAIFLAFVFSRQLYTPVKLLWRKAELLLGKEQNSKNTGEFALIESYFSTVANKITNLENFKNRNLYQLREEVMRNLLTNKLNVEGKDEKLRELGITLGNNNKILLVLFRLDQYKQFTESNNESDQLILKFALANIALEIFEKSWKGVATDLGNDQVAIILDMEEPSYPDDILVERLIHLTREIQEIYKNYYGISFSAFLGSTIYGINKAHILYKNVLALSNYRIINGTGCILCERDSFSNRLSKFDIYNSNINNLLDSLKLGKIDLAYANLDSILTTLRQCDYNIIMFSLSFISSSIFNALSIIEKNSVLVFGIDFVSFNNRLSALDTLEEIKDEYANLFRVVYEKMHQRKEQGSDTLITSVIRHIEANYRQKDLCTDSLADIFKLSPPYLGKIFRENTSKSISEYITDIRMAKARELLEHGSHTIDDIIEKIGWENKKYFYTIFKKTFGVTPTEYRLKIKVTL